jgi:uroporphyrin-3 C-methyltransferase
VILAAQQLQLAGNVQGAVLALQAADARLAGSNRPQFISLRKVLGRDLDRLRALPQIDMPGMNLRLENVIAAIDNLPLAIDARPRAEGKPKATDDAASPAVSAASLDFWLRMGAEFWGEMRSLVRIQRFDRDEPALLAPGQAFFLRENLKLRLLNARLALLARDQLTFRNELKQAQSWIDRYFDARDKSLQTAQGALKQLAATEINIELPTLNESLSAIKTFKLGKEQK